VFFIGDVMNPEEYYHANKSAVVTILSSPIEMRKGYLRYCQMSRQYDGFRFLIFKIRKWVGYDSKSISQIKEELKDIGYALIHYDAKPDELVFKLRFMEPAAS